MPLLRTPADERSAGYNGGHLRLADAFKTACVWFKLGSRWSLLRYARFWVAHLAWQLRPLSLPGSERAGRGSANCQANAEPPALLMLYMTLCAPTVQPRSRVCWSQHLRHISPFQARNCTFSSSLLTPVCGPVHSSYKTPIHSLNYGFLTMLRPSPSLFLLPPPY